jgi:hypothetical protein
LALLSVTLAGCLVEFSELRHAQTEGLIAGGSLDDSGLDPFRVGSVVVGASSVPAPEGLAKLGMIPPDAWDGIRERGSTTVMRIGLRVGDTSRTSVFVLEPHTYSTWWKNLERPR